jgi:MFS family permease
MPFVRDRFTWLTYLMLAYYAYLQSIPGPIMPFLRSELHLSYTVRGLHFSALAVGILLSSLVADRIPRQYGFWIGGAGSAVGAVILGIGRHPAITISGTLILGFVGTFLLTAIQSSLADLHGPNRATALTEANIGASITASLAPLLVGGFQRIGLGWRMALFGMASMWVLMFVIYRHEPIPAYDKPETPDIKTKGQGGLSPVFWVYWAALVTAASVEWCIIFWGPDFLDTAKGLSKADASLCMSLFFVAMVIGRAVGSRITRRSEVSHLLVRVLGLATCGFLVFWLSPVLPLTIVGLFIAGLGVANLYPFFLSTVVTVAADRSAVASARISLGVGLALLIMPQALGSVADQIGLQKAYSIAGVLLLLAIGVTMFANRLAMRHNLVLDKNKISI